LQTKKKGTITIAQIMHANNTVSEISKIRLTKYDKKIIECSPVQGAEP